MASLGLVSPGAATEGITPLFFPEKTDDLFLVIRVCLSVLHFCSVTPIYFLLKNWRLFFAITLISLGCHPTPFLPVWPHFSTILCKFTHQFFFHLHVILWRVLPGAVCPHPSDATESAASCNKTRKTSHDEKLSKISQFSASYQQYIHFVLCALLTMFL